MVEYKYVNKKLVGGKTKRIYKKQDSNKQYLKNNGKMMRITEYRKKVSNKKKGGAFFSIDGTIKDLKRIEIDTYQGFSAFTAPMKTKNKKMSLQIVLKNENGRTINSSNFTGFVDFSAIEILQDGSISANIILVIFQNNNSEILKNATKIHQLYQKLDTVLSIRQNSDKLSEAVDKIKNNIKTYTICSIDNVKYTGNSSIDAEEFKKMQDDKIKSAFRTKLQNVGVNENETKVFYINNIKFTSANCKELQALIQTGNQVHPILPKMATFTTDKLYNRGTSFLKVMVPSIWYTSSISLNNVDEHKKLQLRIFEKLIDSADVKKNSLDFEKRFRGVLGLFGMKMGGLWTFLGITAAANAGFFLVFGPATLAVTSYIGLNWYLKQKNYSKINEDNIDSAKRMIISGTQNKDSNKISSIFSPQQQPQRVPQQQRPQSLPLQQPLQRPQQPPQRMLTQPQQRAPQPPQRMLSQPQQRVQSLPLQQLSRAPLQQPLRVQSLQQQFRPQQQFIGSQLGGKLKIKGRLRKSKRNKFKIVI